MDKKRDYDRNIFFGPSYRGNRQRYLQEAILYLNNLGAVSRTVDRQSGMTPESIDILVRYDDGDVIMTPRDVLDINGIRINNKKPTGQLWKVELRTDRVSFTIHSTQGTHALGIEFPITYHLNFSPRDQTSS